MFLPVLLLNLERKSGTQNSSRQGEKCHTENSEKRSDSLSCASLRHLVAVANRREGDEPPPQGVAKCNEVTVFSVKSRPVFDSCTNFGIVFDLDINLMFKFWKFYDCPFIAAILYYCNSYTFLVGSRSLDLGMDYTELKE